MPSQARINRPHMIYLRFVHRDNKYIITINLPLQASFITSLPHCHQLFSPFDPSTKYLPNNDTIANMKPHLFSVFAIAASVIALPTPQEEGQLTSSSCAGKKVEDVCEEHVSYS